MFYTIEKNILIEAAEAIANEENTYMCYAIEDATYRHTNNNCEAFYSKDEFQNYLEKQGIQTDGTLGLPPSVERKNIRILYLCMLAAAYDDL